MIIRDHFYTISESERDNAIASFSYVPEGVVCYVFGTESTGTVPLFRLQKGDHLYTTSQTERDAAIAQFGYISEGIACYVYAEATGTVPLYRLSTQGSRLYTVSLDERDKAIKDYGYVSDGLACQVFGWQASGTVPLFRLLGVAPNLVIVGVEATQGIQYWNTPAGQGSGFVADNGIPLVSERETDLRVYVAAGSGGSTPPAAVDGVVTVSGFSPALGFASSLDLHPHTGPITTKPLGSIQRSSMTDTLNFTIPSVISQGSIRCDVKVFAPANPGTTVSTAFSLSFTLVPRLVSTAFWCTILVLITSTGL